MRDQTNFLPKFATDQGWDGLKKRRQLEKHDQHDEYLAAISGEIAICEPAPWPPYREYP